MAKAVLLRERVSEYPQQSIHILNFFKSILIVLLAAIMLGIIFSLLTPHGLSPARAEPASASITISPPSETIQACQKMTVEIWVNDIVDLYGADVRISFDPSVISVVDPNTSTTKVELTHGNFLKPPYYVIYNQADNATGDIKYALTQLSPTLPVSGSGILFKFALQAKSSGTSSMHFTYTKLGDKNGMSIPVTPYDGSVLTEPPQSPQLVIARLNASDARLSWPAVAGVGQYRLYRNIEPYFTPSEPAYQTTSNLYYDDLGALGDINANYFYVVKSACPSGFTSNSSNRVGEFDFVLTRNTSNAIALPLIDSNLTDADSLGNATGSLKISRWMAATQSFNTRMVGLSGYNFPLQTGQGYFIYASSAATPTLFTTVGGVPEAGSISFPIDRGSVGCRLNLISLPLDQSSLLTADALAGAIGGIPKIMEWRAATGSFLTRLVGLSGYNFPTRIGYTYWPCANTSGGGSSWP